MSKAWEVWLETYQITSLENGPSLLIYLEKKKKKKKNPKQNMTKKKNLIQRHE